ncbi:MAG: cobalamin-binding protein [bacterium]
MTKLIKLPVLLLLLTLTANVQAIKIISLAPHLTELTFAAGAGKQLIGVDEYSDFPPEAKNIHRIGNAFQLSYENILASKPDIILAWDGGTPKGSIDKLKQLGLNVISLKQQKLEDIASSIRQIGRLAHTEKKAEQAAHLFEQRLKQITTNQSLTPVPVFIQLSTRPLYTVSGKHIISEALRLCGGKNIFSDLDTLSTNVSLEMVVSRSPQLIVASSDEQLAIWQKLEPAQQPTALLKINPDLLYRATPRMLEGVSLLCHKISELSVIK